MAMPLGTAKTKGRRGLSYRRASVGGMAAERVIPPLEAGERQMLSAWLDLQRATLAMKCDGLSDEQLREQAVPPSSLSLLGLVRHMAEVERNWFRPLLAGEEMGGLWAPGPELDPEPAFRRCGDGRCGGLLRGLAGRVRPGQELADAAASLEVTGMRGGSRFSLRWVMVHMIEEYARHNGHADLLRERIDGTTGA